MKKYRLLTQQGYWNTDSDTGWLIGNIYNENETFQGTNVTVKDCVKSEHLKQDWEEVNEESVEDILTKYFTDKKLFIKTEDYKERIIMYEIFDKLNIDYHDYDRKVIFTELNEVLYSFITSGNIHQCSCPDNDEKIINFSDIIEEIKQLNK